MPGPALVRDGRVVRKALEGAMPAADAAIFAEVVSEPERAHASSLLYRHFQLRDLPALAEQAAAVGERAPDVLALQEVTARDHVFCSSELQPVACAYHHDRRDAGLSDHSALEADLAWCAFAMLAR